MNNTPNPIEWIKVSEVLPPEKVTVKTKIDDENGERCVTELKRIGKCWSYVAADLYTSYVPTHWKYIK